jgi:hypothetical protein
MSPVICCEVAVAGNASRYLLEVAVAGNASRYLLEVAVAGNASSYSTFNALSPQALGKNRRKLTVRHGAEYEVLGYNHNDNDHDGDGDYDSSRPVISHIYRASHL